jgi:gamma-glutamylcyclotransferase
MCDVHCTQPVVTGFLLLVRVAFSYFVKRSTTRVKRRRPDCGTNNRHAMELGSTCNLEADERKEDALLQRRRSEEHDRELRRRAQEEQQCDNDRYEGYHEITLSPMIKCAPPTTGSSGAPLKGSVQHDDIPATTVGGAHLIIPSPHMLDDDFPGASSPPKPQRVKSSSPTAALPVSSTARLTSVPHVPHHRWYFAYGSNMNIAKLLMRVQTPLVAERRLMVLRNYKLRFEKKAIGGVRMAVTSSYSRARVFPPAATRLHGPTPGVAYANVSPSASDCVFGIAYLLDSEQLSFLDCYEGVAEGHYRRETLLCVDNLTHTTVPCVVYVANARWVASPDEDVLPTKSYLNHLLAGRGLLPPDYVAVLEAQGTIDA